MDAGIQLAQVDTEILSNTAQDDSNNSTGFGASGLQQGLDGALDRFRDVPSTDTGNTIELNTVQKDDSPMELLRERVSEYVDFESAVDNRLQNMPVPETTGVQHMDKFIEHTQDMLSLQVSYQYKSLNGALLLSTAKSAEGFIKTLMRSQ